MRVEKEQYVARSRYPIGYPNAFYNRMRYGQREPFDGERDHSRSGMLVLEVGEMQGRKFRRFCLAVFAGTLLLL